MRTLLFILLLCTSQLLAKDHGVLFPAKMNGLWGYVDVHGEWVIKARYFKALPFQEGVAAVKDYNRWGFINADGEFVIAAQYERATSFEEGLAAVVYDNRWGFINGDGETIIPFIYEKASSFSEGLAVVSANGNLHYIDHTGNTILDGAFTEASPFAEGLARVAWGSKSGFINSRGHLVIQGAKRTGLFSEGLARSKQSGVWGYMDRSGNIAIDHQYEQAGRFHNGVAPVKRKGKWSVITRSGSELFKEKFEKIDNFYHGYAVARKDDYFGVVDLDGNWVIDPLFHGMGKAGKSVSLRQEMTEHIQLAIARWKTRSEFEKSTSYEQRMTPDALQHASDSLYIAELRHQGDAMLQSTVRSLGYYNADEEYFPFYISGFLPAGIRVPIDKAPAFKSNWDRAQISAASYGLAGEYFVLKDFKVLLGSHVFDEIVTDPVVASAAGWVTEMEIPVVSWEETDVVVSKTRAKAGSSHVDVNIPVTGAHRPNTFALIIGNEDYKEFQGGFNDEINVMYAATDALVFSKYVKQTLGVPQENITLIQNATAGQMQQALAKMNKIVKTFDGNAEVIFYYAGHGLPDEISKKPYLIPVDVNGSDLSFAIQLDDALNTLAEHPHTRITVFLDACFTGGGRNESLLASRGVKIRPKSPFVRGNLIMFAASSGNQSAFAHDEQAHGMFTYFLLKKLQETSGRVTFGELAAYLNREVARSSIIFNDKEQNPDVLVSPSLDEVWQTFNLLTPYEAAVSTRK